MQSMGREFRMRLAGTPFTGRQVAEQMGMVPSRFFYILRDERPMPPDFAERFDTALQALAEQRAEQIRQQAEEEARQVLATVSDREPMTGAAR